MTSVISRMRPDETTSRSKQSKQAQGMPSEIALLPIGADLLPRQAATARGGRRTRVVAAGIVVAAVLGVVAGDVLSHAGRSTAEDRLQSAQDQQLSLNRRLAQYGDLVSARSQANALQSAVAGLMKSDTPWATAIAAAVGAHGQVAVTDAALTAADTTATGAASSIITTPGAIGTMTLQGKAPDKASIAAFADAVAGLKGFTTPFVSSASQADGSGFSFTMTVDLTPELRTLAPQRWTTTTTGGGK